MTPQIQVERACLGGKEGACVEAMCPSAQTSTHKKGLEHTNQVVMEGNWSRSPGKPFNGILSYYSVVWALKFNIPTVHWCAWPPEQTPVSGAFVEHPLMPCTSIANIMSAPSINVYKRRHHSHGQVTPSMTKDLPWIPDSCQPCCPLPTEAGATCGRHDRHTRQRRLSGNNTFHTSETGPGVPLCQNNWKTTGTQTFRLQNSASHVCITQHYFSTNQVMTGFGGDVPFSILTH